MTDHLKLLRSVGEDELFTCLRLLALSVAQHRDSNGFVSLGSSLQSLQDAVANDPDHALGAEVLEEALEAVQVAAAGATEASEGVGESLSPEEKRSQYRINVRIPVKVLWPGESEPVAAQLEMKPDALEAELKLVLMKSKFAYSSIASLSSCAVSQRASRAM